MRYQWSLATTATLSAFSIPVVAHVSEGGIVDSYSGLLHPFTEPLHIIAILGLGLMLSQQGRSIPPAGWLGYCVAALGGLIATGTTGLAAPANTLLLPLAFGLGLLVAIRPLLPRRLCLLLAVITGFILGLDSIAGITGAGELIITIFSTTTGLAIALLIVIGWGDALTRDWQKTGIRVVGSWIAASALLVFALGMRAG